MVNEVNEPDGASNQPPTNTVDINNVAGLFNIAVFPESNGIRQMRPTMLPVRSSANVNIGAGQNQIPPIGISSVPTVLRPNSTPTSLAAVIPLPIFQLPPRTLVLL